MKPWKFKRDTEIPMSVAEAIDRAKASIAAMSRVDSKDWALHGLAAEQLAISALREHVFKDMRESTPKQNKMGIDAWIGWSAIDFKAIIPPQELTNNWFKFGSEEYPVWQLRPAKGAWMYSSSGRLITASETASRGDHVDKVCPQCNGRGCIDKRHDWFWMERIFCKRVPSLVSLVDPGGRFLPDGTFQELTDTLVVWPFVGKRLLLEVMLCNPHMLNGYLFVAHPKDQFPVNTNFMSPDPTRATLIADTAMHLFDSTKYSCAGDCAAEMAFGGRRNSYRTLIQQDPDFRSHFFAVMNELTESP